MSRIHLAVLLGLGCVAGGSFAQPPSIPDAAAIQAAAAGARQALERNQVDEIVAASLALEGQLVRLPDADTRGLPLMALQSQLTQALRRQWPDTQVVGHLEQLDALAQALDRGRNLAAWSLFEALVQLKVATGDAAGARDVLIAAIAREEAYFGPEYPPVRSARMVLTKTLALLGQIDEAIAMAEEAFDATVAIYGAGTAESAEILVTMAELHLDAENQRTAIVLADRAAPIVRQNMLSISPLTERLGQLYLRTAQLEKAREMYQLMEGILHDAFPNITDLRLRLFRNLAIVNARLGDGAAARSYLTAALDLARTSFQQAPGQILETLLLEARIFALAGMFEEARAALAQSESFAVAAGLDGTAGFRSSLAYESLTAMDLVRSRSLAEAAMAMAEEGSAVYAAAGNTLVIASALSDPPESRLELANALLARAETASPQGRQLRERHAVAVALAAAGRWEESAAMQREIIVRESAESSEDMTNQLQLTTYAAALAELGRSEEQASVLARIEARRAPLVAVFSNQLGREVLVQQYSGFGFEIELDDPRWQRARPASIGLPMAAFTATYNAEPGQGDGSIAVVPLLLPEGIGADVAVEAISDLVHADVRDLVAWSDGEFSGYTARSVEPHFSTGLPVVHLSRIIVESGAVYAIVTSAAESRPEVVAAAEAALERVRIRPGAGIADLSAAELELHGAILNYAGNVLFQLGSLADARDLYRHAADYNDADYVTENLASAQYYLGDFAGTVATLDANFARFGETDENLAHQLMRADSYLELGDIDRALPAFAGAFGLGARDDELAGVYAGTLIELERGAEALDFIDEYMIGNDTVDLHALRAISAYAAGDEARLGESSAVLRDPARSNPDVALMLAVIALDRDGEAGLDRLIGELAGARLDSPTLYLMLAGSQIESGRPQGARATIESGLERFPDDPDLGAAAASLPATQEPEA